MHLEMGISSPNFAFLKLNNIDDIGKKICKYNTVFYLNCKYVIFKII